VVVSYSNSEAMCEVTLGDAWRVRPDTRLISELGAWLAPENVEVLYSST
jgi:DNA polymerase-3 subunit alpha